jgi:hypothetical protein
MWIIKTAVMKWKISNKKTKEKEAKQHKSSCIENQWWLRNDQINEMNGGSNNSY